jgi:hypothetical protein
LRVISECSVSISSQTLNEFSLLPRPAVAEQLDVAKSDGGMCEQGLVDPLGVAIEGATYLSGSVDGQLNRQLVTHSGCILTGRRKAEGLFERPCTTHFHTEAPAAPPPTRGRSGADGAPNGGLRPERRAPR